MHKNTIREVRIISNNISIFSTPSHDEEVEQELTINDEGEVSFSGYDYADYEEKLEKSRTRTSKIPKEKADKLLAGFTIFFDYEYIVNHAIDVGSWDLEITSKDGKVRIYTGSLCTRIDYEGQDLSDLVRDTLGMKDLFVFDGRDRPDLINRITLDYLRTTRIEASYEEENGDEERGEKENEEREYLTWKYSERLIIDRKTETLEHIQNVAPGHKVTRKFEVEDRVKRLLDSFDPEAIFTNIEGNPDDAIGTPDEEKDYIITIDCKNGTSRAISGSFDKKGLPDDFGDFIEKVIDFMYYYGFGEIFSKANYNGVKRRKSDYIYCSVSFSGGYKTYYYITDDDSIEVGDLVIVPAGRDNHEAVVEVEEIEYFSEDEVPLPVEKTKRIIRKYLDDDFA